MTRSEKIAFEQIIGEKLHAAIGDAHLTYYEVAKRLGISDISLSSKLEGINSTFKPSELFEICDMTRLDIPRLFIEAWSEVSG